MAVQVSVDELKDCSTYFGWLTKMAVQGNDSSSGDVLKRYASKDYIPNGKKKNEHVPVDSIELLKYLFERDFVATETMKDDENRAADAMELRRRYADDVGQKANKSSRDIDRIWKSVKGKASCLEVILTLCVHLDTMVNEEDEPWSMVPQFFGILIRNLGLDKFDDEDFDLKEEVVKKYWDNRIHLFLNREYGEDGSGGGIFPIQNQANYFGKKDQKNESLWVQMNNWVLANVDEDGYFIGDNND